jgi:hypothetical protein
MFRALIWLVLIGAFIFFGATVKLGNRTFFGHVRAIWKTDEAQDLKHGVQEKAGPAAKKLEKGVKAGLDAMKEDGSGGSGAGSQVAPVRR